jgi:hypothetical protein
MVWSPRMWRSGWVSLGTWWASGAVGSSRVGWKAWSTSHGLGAPRRITDGHVEEVIVKTLEQQPSNQDSHWSTRSMAKAAGLSQTAVSRIWRAFGLKPHLVDTWKLSADPLFVEKVRDVVGLYLDPPVKAMVLCVDEKSQMQALERTRPMLPMMPTVPTRQTHDYVRHGVASLFAAFDPATGTVIGQVHRKHRPRSSSRS